MSFVVAGPKCLNKLPFGLRDLSVGHETFARHLKTLMSRDWQMILRCHHGYPEDARLRIQP